MKKADVERLNRRLLEASFPGALEPMVWETDRRRAADFAALLGNTNLALLLSTVVALAMYYRQRKPTVTQLAHTVETADERQRDHPHHVGRRAPDVCCRKPAGEAILLSAVRKARRPAG